MSFIFLPFQCISGSIRLGFSKVASVETVCVRDEAPTLTTLTVTSTLNPSVVPLLSQPEAESSTGTSGTGTAYHASSGTNTDTSHVPDYPQCMYTIRLLLSAKVISSLVCHISKMFLPCSDYYPWRSSLGSISLGWYNRYVLELLRESILLYSKFLLEYISPLYYRPNTPLIFQCYHLFFMQSSCSLVDVNLIDAVSMIFLSLACLFDRHVF